MSKLSLLQQELNDVTYLKSITQALGEVSAIQLKNTKNQILQNSLYYQELNRVYQTVHAIAAKRHFFTENEITDNSNIGSVPKLLVKLSNKVSRHKDIAHADVGNKLDKTLSLLLTSNSGLHGGIDTTLSRYFLDDMKKSDSDRVVVGSMGISLVSSFDPDFSFNPHKFNKDLPTLQEVQELVKVILKYKKVIVYYTRYESLLKQSPTKTDITVQEELATEDGISVDYILEPELDKIVEFFEGQIFVLILESIFLQQDLARYGARMVAMNRAEDNADLMINLEKRLVLHAKKQLMNTQILESFSSRKRKKKN
jgi:F-type H+-transporting ATPase subunit gamma